MGGLDPCQPKATHGHPNTRVEYQAETADVRFIKEHDGSGQPDGNEAGCQQSQLDKLWPDKNFKCLTPKHNREQLQYLAQDVHLKDRDQRRVKLSKGS